MCVKRHRGPAAETDSTAEQQPPAAKPRVISFITIPHTHTHTALKQAVRHKQVNNQSVIAKKVTQKPLPIAQSLTPTQTNKKKHTESYFTKTPLHESDLYPRQIQPHGTVKAAPEINFNPVALAAAKPSTSLTDKPSRTYSSIFQYTQCVSSWHVQ